MPGTRYRTLVPTAVSGVAPRPNNDAPAPITDDAKAQITNTTRVSVLRAESNCLRYRPAKVAETTTPAATQSPPEKPAESPVGQRCQQQNGPRALRTGLCNPGKTVTRLGKVNPPVGQRPAKLAKAGVNVETDRHLPGADNPGIAVGTSVSADSEMNVPRQNSHYRRASERAGHTPDITLKTLAGRATPQKPCGIFRQEIPSHSERATDVPHTGISHNGFRDKHFSRHMCRHKHPQSKPACRRV